jgi:hypothetical protein
MINNRLIFTVIMGVVVSAVNLPVRSESTPDLSVSIDLLPDGQHYLGDPLLISIGISNQNIRNTTIRNEQHQRLSQRLKNSKEYQTLSADDQKYLRQDLEQETLTSFTLGSHKRSLLDLIKITLKTSTGETESVPIRKLAWNTNSENKIILDEKTYPIFYFGIDSDQLEKLTPGNYSLQATIDSTQESGMWQGIIRSPSEAFTLTKASGKTGGLNASMRDYLAARFYLLDKKYENVEKHAGRILQRKNMSFHHYAWEFRGDVALAISTKDEARKHYHKALTTYDERTAAIQKQWKQKNLFKDSPEPYLEDPQHIRRKLYELDRGSL